MSSRPLEAADLPDTEEAPEVETDEVAEVLAALRDLGQRVANPVVRVCLEEPTTTSPT
jgi:hypothetical protein